MQTFLLDYKSFAVVFNVCVATVGTIFGQIETDDLGASTPEVRQRAVSRSAGEDRERVRQILATDIGTRVLIIGRLGKPLAEMITIRGQWVEPDFRDRARTQNERKSDPSSPKDPLPRFRVFEVDGRKLEEPQTFPQSLFFPAHEGALAKLDPRRERGKGVWELRGAETGRYLGSPGVLAVDNAALVQEEFVYGFYTEFRYISFKRVK
jgi:hypothetical protein